MLLQLPFTLHVGFDILNMATFICVELDLWHMCIECIDSRYITGVMWL